MTKEEIARIMQQSEKRVRQSTEKVKKISLNFTKIMKELNKVI